MLSYLTIFAASLCGYAGLMAPLVIGVLTVALASLSYAERYQLYKRSAELGLFDQINSTLVSSTFNAFWAVGASYGAGMVARFLSGL